MNALGFGCAGLDSLHGFLDVLGGHWRIACDLLGFLPCFALFLWFQPSEWPNLALCWLVYICRQSFAHLSVIDKLVGPAARHLELFVDICFPRLVPQDLP